MIAALAAQGIQVGNVVIEDGQIAVLIHDWSRSYFERIYHPTCAATCLLDYYEDHCNHP